MISAALYPCRRSAPVFQVDTRPSTSIMKMAKSLIPSSSSRRCGSESATKLEGSAAPGSSIRGAFGFTVDIPWPTLSDSRELRKAGVGHRNGGHVDDSPNRGRWRQDVHGLGKPQQEATHRHPFARGH